MKDPKFNWEQMREISLAMEYGLKPDTLCDPEINAESMEKIRYSLMDQQSVFEDAKEEVKKKRIKRISLIIFTVIVGFIVSIIYLMNKDTIDKYIEPVPLELTTDRVTVENIGIKNIIPIIMHNISSIIEWFLIGWVKKL